MRASTFGRRWLDQLADELVGRGWVEQDQVDVGPDAPRLCVVARGREDRVAEQEDEAGELGTAEGKLLPIDVDRLDGPSREQARFVTGHRLLDGAHDLLVVLVLQLGK